MGRKIDAALAYSDQAVKTAIKEVVASGGERKEWRIEGVPGLVLRARHTGVGSWHFYYSGKAGARRKPKIGEYPSTALATARERADEWRRLVAAGGDPVGEAEAKAAGTTFGELVEMRLAVGDLRPGTVKAYRMMLDLDAASIMDTPASEVTSRQIVKLIDARLAKEGAFRQADYFKTALSSVFKFGVERRIVDANPTLGLGKRDSAVPRTRTMTSAELVTMWQGLSAEAPLTGEPKRHKQGRVPRAFNLSASMRLVLRLLILTGQRRAEVVGARVSELRGLDGDSPHWVIPGDVKARGKTARVVFGRTKNGREQVVPLSRQAAELFREALALRQDASSPFVFPADERRVKVGAAPLHGHIDPKSVTRASKRFWQAQGVDDVTVHDCRRTMASWLGEQEMAGDVIRLALNHSATDVTGRVYNHAKLAGPLRRALSAWADHVTGEGVAVVGSGNVVAFHKVPA